METTTVWIEVKCLKQLPSDKEIEKKVLDTVNKYKSINKLYPELVPSNKDIIIELIRWMRDFRFEKQEDKFLLTKDDLKDFAQAMRKYTIDHAEYVPQAGNSVWITGSVEDFMDEQLLNKK